MVCVLCVLCVLCVVCVLCVLCAVCCVVDIHLIPSPSHPFFSSFRKALHDWIPLYINEAHFTRAKPLLVGTLERLVSYRGGVGGAGLGMAAMGLLVKLMNSTVVAIMKGEVRASINHIIYTLYAPCMHPVYTLYTPCIHPVYTLYSRTYTCIHPLYVYIHLYIRHT